MNFVRSGYFTNEPRTSWTLFSSIWGTFQYLLILLNWGKKYTTGQRFIRYKAHTLNIPMMFYDIKWSHKLFSLEFWRKYFKNLKFTSHLLLSTGKMNCSKIPSKKTQMTAEFFKIPIGIPVRIATDFAYWPN